MSEDALLLKLSADLRMNSERQIPKDDSYCMQSPGKRVRHVRERSERYRHVIQPTAVYTRRCAAVACVLHTFARRAMCVLDAAVCWMQCAQCAPCSHRASPLEILRDKPQSRQLRSGFNGNPWNPRHGILSALLSSA